MLALHRRGDEEHMRRHAGLRVAVAGRGHGVQAADEGELALGD
jgi:hypothetical protein